jgi:hypothetical protein
MEDLEKLPEGWYSKIEKSREKARTLLNEVVAVDLNTSIVVGKLEDVMLDKLFRLKYPFCKLTLSKAKRFSINGKYESSSDMDQVCFINKPQMLMDLDEFSRRFPDLHEDIHVEIKRGRFD